MDRQVHFGERSAAEAMRLYQEVAYRTRRSGSKKWCVEEASFLTDGLMRKVNNVKCYQELSREVCRDSLADPVLGGSPGRRCPKE
jgi:hypothetical protein